MNPNQVGELLDRAARSVTPAEADPATRLAELGRRSIRRRRAWTAAGAVAAAVAAVVTLPFVVAVPLPLPDLAGPRTVTVGDVSVAVPLGWRVREVGVFDPCNPQPRSVYVADEYRFNHGQPSVGPGVRYGLCEPPTEGWIGVVRRGVTPTINGAGAVVKDGRLLQAEQMRRHDSPLLWSYRTMSPEFEVPAVIVAGDDEQRDDLLDYVTWSGGQPTPPPGGGLALPEPITYAQTDKPPHNHMVVAQSPETLEQIRTILTGLRDGVPPGEECTLGKPGSIGITFGEMTVVVGDASCPQAISTGGGRVRVPADLGQQLLDLIVADNDAISGRERKKEKD